MKQIGTVEILRARVYPVDGDSGEPRVFACVEPGVFPLFAENDYSHFWVMTGKLNGGGARRLGDGLTTLDEGDVPLDIDVAFPSKRLGPDDWLALLSHPVCREGHHEQRLRVALHTDEPHG